MPQNAGNRRTSQEARTCIHHSHSRKVLKVAVDSARECLGKAKRWRVENGDTGGGKGYIIRHGMVCWVLSGMAV